MIDRRDVLKLGAGAAVTATFPFSRSAFAHVDDRPAPFVRDDIGRLRRVLVHSLTPDEYPIDRDSGSLVPFTPTDRETAIRQHAAMLMLLRQSGAETLELADALHGAVEETKRQGSFRTWLSAAHPKLSGDPDSVTADTLLGRDPARQFQQRADGVYQNIMSTAVSTTWTRDISFMTPKGMVICNSASPRRLRENMTLRFAMMHAPQLARYPIVFDAVTEGVLLEGGDAQMVDERTLFLGVGQRTDPRAAPMLARALDLDVVAVHVHKTDFLARDPKSMGPPPVAQLRLLFLHLDTFFTHVDHGHALTVPWLLEMEHAGEDPLSRFIKGARADLAVDADHAAKALAFLTEFGKVSIYQAGSGEKVEMEEELKLVDYVRSRNYRITYVGGEAPEEGDDAFIHFMRVTLNELRQQASNVVATSPRNVVAYEGTPRTKTALERDGITVKTFPARELWPGHGGPHCLTMPLERE